jgi:hypothetical protein
MELPSFVEIGGALVATSQIAAVYIGSAKKVEDGDCKKCIYTRLATGFVLETHADTEEELLAAFDALCARLTM